MARANSTISLTEAAERLGVHYMTAYRYVRTGRLDAVKVGHEWQVAEADVDALLRASAPGRAPGRSRRVDHAGRLVDRLLANDENGAWAVVEQALTGGRSPEEVHTDILAPALVIIGERWQRGEITVADEHQASAIVLRLIGRLGPRFRRRGRSRGTVIVTAPPGDRHSIPTALAADLIRARGFTVIDLGADVPVDALVRSASQADHLVAVSICASTAGNEDAIAEATAALRDAVEAPVVLGGGAIRDADHARSLGATVHSASFDDVVALLDADGAA